MKKAITLCIKKNEKNRRKRIWIAFLQIVVLAFLSSGYTAQAATYDAAAEFSTTNNPNGVWSYGWSSTLASAFNLYSYNGKIIPGKNLDLWVDPTHVASYCPNVLHNATASTITFSSARWKPGQLSFHPGSNGEYSHVRWTAPNAGIFNIAATFTGIDFVYGTTTDVHVLHNGISLSDGLVNGSGNTSLFSSTISVGKNDIIDFAVGYGSNRNYFNDSTALSVTISSIPEPASLLLLGLGGLVLWRKK
jgi:hypothetical protein